ncbi:MAG: MFS transporter, partial [Chloroflexi bacterium]|nr:MFS transporter [Chloroflexota bacterium]
MGLVSALRPLFSTPERKAVLVAVTAAYMLVQLSSLPVALSLPSLADYFDTGVDDAAWLVIIYLLAMGSFVLLGARLGDRYGHARVFFAGLVITTIAAVLIAMSNSLIQVIAWRAVSGLGSALVMGNANAILAYAFPPEERGRAFSIPIVGARFGTLTGLAIFGFFLQFLSWRLVFFSFLPLGIIAIVLSIPMLKTLKPTRTDVKPESVDFIGAILLIATASALILSGNHLHGGEESFISAEGLRFHLPMNALFILLFGVFILFERSAKSPIVELKHFKQKYFSMALISNVSYHFSMLATMTLIPILVERGFGLGPLWVTVVLLPSQILGMILPFVAGWIHDRYQPKFMRPGAMVAIAGGFLILAMFSGSVLLLLNMGQELFPPVDSQQFTIYVRMPSGTRIERTEETIAKIEAVLIEEIGQPDPGYALGNEEYAESNMQILISNIGVLMDWPAAYTPNTGPMDAFILVQLKGKSGKPNTFEIVDALRERLNR